MSDLDAKSAGQPTIILGSDATGNETTPVASTVNGGMHVNLRDNAGTEAGTAANPINTNIVNHPTANGSGTITALNGAVTTVSVSNYSTIAYDVTGTWVATIAIEGTINGTNWFAADANFEPTGVSVTSITTNGQLIIPCAGYLQVRLRASLFTSGTINAAWNASTGINSVEVFNSSAGGLATAASTFDSVGQGITSTLNGAKRSFDVNITNPTGAPVITDPSGTTPQPVSAELFTSYEPDPADATTNTNIKLRLDARGRVETHSTVLSDEGSSADQFIGAALSPAWTSLGTITVSGSNATLNSGTAIGSAYFYKQTDYGPFYISTNFAISQRIANQTIFWGLRDNILSPTQKAEFQFSGIDNTQVTCVSWSTTDPSDVTTTQVTIPKNLTTAVNMEWGIEVTIDSVSFTLNDQVLARHTEGIPGIYTILQTFFMATNTAVVTNTTLISKWIVLNNVNRVEIGSSFRGSPLEVAKIQLEDTDLQTFSAAALNLASAATATDIFTITGSATKTIKIRKITISGVQTTAGVANVVLLRRTSANTGGTSTLLTAALHDSDDVIVSSASVRSYTANPTLGTLQANIRAYKLFVPSAVSLVATSTLEINFGADGKSKPIVLRGITEVLAINLASTTYTGSSFDISIEWTEE